MKIHFRKSGQTLCGVPYHSASFYGKKEANTTTTLDKVTCKTCIRLRTMKMVITWKVIRR